MRRIMIISFLVITSMSVWGQVSDTGDKVGVGTTNPASKLHIVDNKRMAIRFGGPSTSSGAVSDLTFHPSNNTKVGDASYWNWSFRTDSWSSQPGDLVLYSHNGTNYTSPIIFQADGDIALGTGNGAGRFGRVGIGTYSPTSLLEVKSTAGTEAEIHINTTTDGKQSILRFQDAGVNTWGFLSHYPGSGQFSLYNYQTNSNTMVFNPDGRVGIGTTTPASKFDVRDTKRMAIRFGGPSSSSGALADLQFFPADNKGVGGANFWTWSFRTDTWSSQPGDLVLYSHNGTNYTSPIIFQADGDIALATGNGSSRNGKVAIGTTDFSGNHLLRVEGSIGARKIIVEAGVWSDYVFDDDYTLRSLEEVEKHIKSAGHLPEIPNEIEITENGIDLGQMDTKLLQKIEELTLYLIEQHHEIEALKEKLELLSNNSK